jgi:sRNA-binding protein
MSEHTTNTELTIVRKENVQLIAQTAPEVYKSNTTSCQKCTDFGKKLLAQIKANGMNDELDMQCATYINKARNTVKKMNTNRSAITKLFDQIRSEFTGMENAIDPNKTDSIPYQIQQARNAYAAKKREEEERKRREEMMRQQREQALVRYKAEVEDGFKRQFNVYTTNATNELTKLNSSLTLENYEAQSKIIREYPVTLPANYIDRLKSTILIPIPAEIADMRDQLPGIRSSILSKLMQQFHEQFQFEVGEYRDNILDMLPSKKAELERMQKADKEEKARMAAKLMAQEEAEAKRIEKERKRKEEEEAAKKKMQQEASDVNSLFAGQAIVTPEGYRSKTSIKKRLVFHDAQGVLAAVSMWWSKEGQFMSVEELTKIFKKQITFCEKVANDKAQPEFISSTSVSYEEEVKAK